MANLGGKKLKAGHVASIRVNPADCQGVLDVMKAIGVDPYDGRSFAQCVSLALSSLLGMARMSGAIEKEPDPSQFWNRMAYFNGGKNTKIRQGYADSLYRGAASGVEVPSLDIPHIQATSSMQHSQELTEEYVELSEVLNNAPQEFTEQMQDRYLELSRILGY